MKEERLKFSERFTEIAKQLGYDGHGKQTSLARHYNLAQPSVKKWFDGDAMPDFEICVDLCKRSRVHYEWFMTGRGPKSMDDIPLEDARMAHVLTAMQTMSDYKIDQTVKIVDTLAERAPGNGTTDH